MGKVFNTTGACNPEKHYMVDISGRLAAIKLLVDMGDYFTINRAKQYGKTTTLLALKKYLNKDYLIIFLDFQFLSKENYESEKSFVQAFSDEIIFEGKKLII